MQQITLALDPDEADRPGPVLDPERERQLIEAMAQALIAVGSSQGGRDDETE